MPLAFVIAMGPIDPEGPDPPFTVDEPGFRLELTAWPAPAPQPLDDDVLCTVSLSTTPDGARVDLRACPPVVAPAVLGALQGWRLRASSAPPRETEVLRLAWRFRPDGTVEGFVSAPGAIARRFPSELTEVVDEGPSSDGSSAVCVDCEPWWWDCRVRVEVDVGGRPTAEHVSGVGSPDDCPPEVWDDARAAAVTSRRWPVVGADGWPAAYAHGTFVQVPRGPRRATGPPIELRDELPVGAGP